MEIDLKFMNMALEQAKIAYSLDEVPVGAVLVRGGKVICRSHNLTKAASDATSHAELLAIREGSRLCDGRLDGTTLYVTLEPCAMCAGAAILSRVSRIVFGAFDDHAGCCGSVVDMTDNWFNHSIEVVGGIMEDECAHILTDFFEQKRA